jgi:hypothetical protein
MGRTAFSLQIRDHGTAEPLCRQTWSIMEQDRRLRVEVYAHGGWWKDSTGQTGQVSQAQASKGPMATVAAVSNSFGTEGWKLTEVVNGHHNSYHLSFERAPEEE